MSSAFLRLIGRGTGASFHLVLLAGVLVVALFLCAAPARFVVRPVPATHYQSPAGALANCLGGNQ